jgi:hypothetical protein
LGFSLNYFYFLHFLFHFTLQSFIFFHFLFHFLFIFFRFFDKLCGFFFHNLLFFLIIWVFFLILFLQDISSTFVDAFFLGDLSLPDRPTPYHDTLLPDRPTPWLLPDRLTPSPSILDNLSFLHSSTPYFSMILHTYPILLPFYSTFIFSFIKFIFISRLTDAIFFFISIFLIFFFFVPLFFHLTPW